MVSRWMSRTASSLSEERCWIRHCRLCWIRHQLKLLWKVVISQGIRAASTTPRQGAWFRPLVVEIQQRIVLDVPEAALRYRNLGPAPAVW